MQFSEQWLRHYANPAVSSEELARRLTMGGLEVEESVPVAPPFAGVQPEAEDRRDKAPGAPAVQPDRAHLAGVGGAPHEQRVDDPQGASALHALERTDELPFEGRIRPEAVQQELRGGSRGRMAHARSVTGDRARRLIPSG